MASRVTEKISKNVADRKLVFRLTNGMYFSTQAMGPDESTAGSPRYELLVTDFVNSLNELNKATVFRYVRVGSEQQRLW